MKHKFWIDYLRCIAIFAVITIHASSPFFAKFNEIGRIEWWLSNIFDSSSRFAVPIFVMISGALLLGREETIDEFYKKRAIRLLPPILFWNLFCMGFSVYKTMDFKNLIWLCKGGLFVEGRSAEHLWYLSMVFCLMLLVPFINKFVNGDKPTTKDLKILFGIILFFFVLNGISNITVNIVDTEIKWFKSMPWFIGYLLAGPLFGQIWQKLSVI